MNFSSLITNEIDGRFCYIKYDEFDLMMIKDNNYINATKLCKLGGKEFNNWIKLKESKELIKTVHEINNFWNIKPHGIETKQKEMIIKVELENNSIKKYDIEGYYIHPDLIPHIVSWIFPLFTVKISKIVNCYISEHTNLNGRELC